VGGRGALGGLAGEGLGYFEEAHVELEEGGVDEGGFGWGEAGFGFGRDDGEHVDGLAGAEDVDLGLLAGGGGTAELHEGLHVEGLDDAVEGHLGDGLHAGVGGADGGVEAVYRGLEGGFGLGGLLGGEGWGFVGVGLVSCGVFGCGWVGDGLGAGEAGGGLELVFLGWGGLEGLRARRFGDAGWGVRAGFAFGGELAAVVDDEFFDFGHGVLGGAGFVGQIPVFQMPDASFEVAVPPG
jgi:hypothetical protein